MKRLFPLMAVLSLAFLITLPMGQAQETPAASSLNLAQAATLAATRAPTRVPTRAATQRPAATGVPSTVQIFFVACDTRAVVNLNGTMQANYDVFFQVFNAAGGAGTAITPVQQVVVSGTYSVSQVVSYNAGSTIPAAGTASVRVTIARETDQTRQVFTTTVNDVQDGCSNPQFQQVSGTPIGGTPGPVSTTQGLQPVAPGTGSGILSPFGGYLNPTYVQQGLVVIGARPVDRPVRNQDAGLVFAECDQYWPAADPGLLYDSDNITVFWSWFTRTREQLDNHIQNAQYGVLLNSSPFTSVVRSEPRQINGNWWVFYTADVDNLRVGFYSVGYRLRWSAPHNDGFDDYGPGTDNEEIYSTCSFEITRNPGNVTVNTNNYFTPHQTPLGGVVRPVRR